MPLWYNNDFNLENNNKFFSKRITFSEKKLDLNLLHHQMEEYSAKKVNEKLIKKLLQNLENKKKMHQLLAEASSKF